MTAPSLPPIALERSPVYALLLRLAGSVPRGGQQLWESAIDGVVRRLHEVTDLPELEAIAAVWQPRLRSLVEELEQAALHEIDVRDLNTIVAAIDCVVEHLSVPRRLNHADLRVAYRRTDAAAVARQACSAFRTLAERRDLAFTVDLPEHALVEVDPAKLETLLLALLFNAFKHTPMRGSIRCSVRRGEFDDRLTISVADSSPGIAAAESAALFDDGVHDRSATLEVGGRTVSLGTARDLARLHGGTLVLRASAKRRGAVFEASLPAQAPQGVPVADELVRTSSLADAVVAQARDELDAESKLGGEVTRDDRPLALIVEDNPHTQRILTLTLGPAYSVASAFDGEEGIAKARELTPDIILTDVRMPHMDGETMVHELRAHPQLASVPILVLTATDDRAVIVRLLEAGVQDVLRKPFEIAEVRARVRALVEAKRARETLNATIGHQEDNLMALAEEVASRQRGLESALGALAIERDNARRANRVKSNFLRMMSHELKTPVAALQLQLHLLERGADGATASTVEGVARMRRSIRRLMLLIETMTEWARVESGRFELEPSRVDLATLLRSAVDDARGSASSKGTTIELEAAALPPLQSDPRLVSLLLQNLIGYVLQLNTRGPLTIGAAAAGDAVQVRLRCRAPGGADETIDADVFSALQDDSDIGARSGTGSGLGLRVVRDIARALGGELELCATGEQGTNLFVMTLRSAPASVRAAPDTPTAGGRHVPPRTANHRPAV